MCASHEPRPCANCGQSTSSPFLFLENPIRVVCPACYESWWNKGRFEVMRARNTPAQAQASRENGKRGGRPPRISTTARQAAAEVLTLFLEPEFLADPVCYAVKLGALRSRIATHPSGRLEQHLALLAHDLTSSSGSTAGSPRGDHGCTQC